MFAAPVLFSLALFALEASSANSPETQPARSRSAPTEQENLVAKAVSEREPEWRELTVARPGPGVKVWRSVGAKTERVGYEPREDVSVTIATYTDEAEARLEMKRRRETIPRPRIGPLEGIGDEAEAWTGFAVPGVTAIHCRAGSIVFSLFAPSREVAERFAGTIAKSLAASTSRSD